MDLETHLVNKNYREAEQLVIGLINLQLTSKLEFSTKKQLENLSGDQRDIANYCMVERLASLLNQLLSDQQYQMSIEMFNQLVTNKKFINNLYCASSYGNTDQIIRNLGLDRRTNHNKLDIMRLLVLILPESSFDLPWPQLIQHMPVEAIRTYIGLMYCAENNLSASSSKRLNAWASMAKDLPVLNFNSPQSMTFIANAYFNISTLTGEGKFEFKKWAVKNYKTFMDSFLSQSQKSSLRDVPKAVQNLEKPTVLVIHEHYKESHAMYRCYHELISNLKDDFNVVGLWAEPYGDEVGAKDHHDMMVYKGLENLSNMVDDILKLKPDVVLYPSLGMNTYTMFLASLRLAPVQCVCPGHPSSSYFDTIDYMLLEDLGIPKGKLKNILSEKPIVMDAPNLHVVPTPFTIDNDKRDDNTVHIGINGVMPKVTDLLINACLEIAKKADREVVYHFFMNSPIQDIEYFSAKSFLRRTLPNSVVHPLVDFNTYMNVLSSFDFVLPTIPFGGANSNFDIARLGIPKLFLSDTSDLPCMTDFYVWNKLGELDGHCESIDALITRAIDWINKPEKLAEAKRKIEEIKVEDFMVDERHTSKDMRLVESIKSTYS